MARADALRTVPTQVRFLSCEPLLGPLPSLDLSGISWLIIGGRIRPRSKADGAVLGARSHPQVPRERDVAVFVKQMGTVWARQHGERGKGGDMATWDEDLRLREYPLRET